MKKVMVLLVAAFVTVMVSKIAFTAQQADAGPAGLKIAMVDLGRALNEVDEGKRAKANLEREFKAKKTELDNIKGEIETLRQGLEKKASVMSAEAMQTERENYQKKFLEYQQKAKDYTEELARKEGEMTGKIIGKLRTVVEDIAKRDGYTFVFEKSQGGVVYGPASADITDSLIKQYK